MGVLHAKLKDDSGRNCGTLWLDHSRHDQEHTQDIPWKHVSCGVLEAIDNCPPTSDDQVQYSRPPASHIKHLFKDTAYYDGATFLSEAHDNRKPVWIVDVLPTEKGVEIDKRTQETAGDAKKLAGGAIMGGGLAVIGATMAVGLKKASSNSPISRRGFLGSLLAGAGAALAGDVVFNQGLEEEKQPLKDAEASERLHQKKGVIKGDNPDHKMLVRSNKREQSPIYLLRSAVNAAKIRTLAKHLKDNPDAWADFLPYGGQGSFDSMYALYGAAHTDIKRFVDHPEEISHVLGKWKNNLPEVLQTDNLHDFTCFRPVPGTVHTGRNWRKKVIQLEVPEFAAIGFPLPEKQEMLSVDTVAPGKKAVEKKALEKNR